MNAKNANLHKAKKEANDEFYTQYEDVAKEIEHYKEHLKGKVIYCNCYIPHFSNFHKYFLDNFKELELKQLIVTGYVKNGNGKCSVYDGEKSTDYDLLGDGDFRGDNCYYINGENGQWVKVALVEVVEFKPSGIVCKFINCSLAEHQKNNYRSDDYVGRLTKPLSNLKLIKIV